MKVLCLNPPGNIIRTGRLVRRSKIHTQSWPPIYLAQATGLLEASDFECKLIDASVTGLTEQDVVKLTNDWKPDKIAYYWAYDTRHDDLAFANLLGAKYDVTLVGPWSAHFPSALDSCDNISAMTFGQFDYTLPKLFNNVDKSRIPGLKYREGNSIVFNPQREPYSTAELDMIPFVTDVYFKHLNIYDYHQTSFRYPFVDLFTASSCPHRCIIETAQILMSNHKKLCLSSVKIGDDVITLNGVGKILNKTLQQEETVLVELDDRKTIITTSDHRFMTRRGWVCAQNLTDRDEVICFE